MGKNSKKKQVDAAAGGGGDGDGDAQPEEVKRSVVEVVFAVSFYWAISLSLVFVNKHVLAGSAADTINAPLFLTWTQVVVAVMCARVLASLSQTAGIMTFFPAFEYDLNIAKQVLPLTLVFVGMVVFNNLCLKYVEVSFYQVARSLTIMFNLVLNFLVLGRTTTAMAVLGCVVVMAGFVIGSEGEVNFSFAGVLFGVTASLFVALYSIVVKRVLPVCNNNTWLLLIYNNMNAMFLMPFFFLYQESDAIVTSPLWFESRFWGVLGMAGMLGFLINIASFTQISYTSPLTHNVSGTFKACVQTALAALFYQNETSTLFWIGFALTVAGSGIYTYSRFRIMASANAGK